MTKVTQADMNNWTAGNIAETLTVIVTNCVKIMITSEPTTISSGRNDQNRMSCENAQWDLHSLTLVNINFNKHVTELKSFDRDENVEPDDGNKED